MDDQGDNLTLVLQKVRGGDHTAEGRRKRELRGIPAKDRKAMRAQSVKDVQLNIKVTREFKTLLSGLSMAASVSMAEFIEQAVRDKADKGVN